jgi:hypothetical protein
MFVRFFHELLLIFKCVYPFVQLAPRHSKVFHVFDLFDHSRIEVNSILLTTFRVFFKVDHDSTSVHYVIIETFGNFFLNPILVISMIKHVSPSHLELISAAIILSFNGISL